MTRNSLWIKCYSWFRFSFFFILSHPPWFVDPLSCHLPTGHRANGYDFFYQQLIWIFSLAFLFFFRVDILHSLIGVRLFSWRVNVCACTGCASDGRSVSLLILWAVYASPFIRHGRWACLWILNAKLKEKQSQWICTHAEGGSAVKQPKHTHTPTYTRTAQVANIMEHFENITFFHHIYMR